ncbi:hypothetical protein CEXT_118611 [Caerostris extrusa]|uniref:Uncharacterized protein n=1 Tax=Caerostris extrusa TaxID=172846 RepID=A0AAV4RD81_CAEEX|nr:hypothetical protein CEXT_118611 [Caerostris extrusa]
MYGQCEGTFGTTPCVYNGPPKQLQKDVPLMVISQQYNFLKSFCPELVIDDDPHVCCSTKTINNNKNQME